MKTSDGEFGDAVEATRYPGRASRREFHEGRGLISALVVEQDSRVPSTGFYHFARQAPFNRRGDDIEIWLAECKRLRRDHLTAP